MVRDELARVVRQRDAAVEFVNDVVNEKLLHGSNPSMVTRAQQLNFLSDDTKRLLEGRMADNTSPLQETQRALKEAQQTIDSIAAMLGWANTPPRKTLEQTISTLKHALKERDETLKKLGSVRQAIADALPPEVYHMTLVEGVTLIVAERNALMARSQELRKAVVDFKEWLEAERDGKSEELKLAVNTPRAIEQLEQLLKRNP